jgi:hypothetical protein
MALTAEQSVRLSEIDKLLAEGISEAVSEQGRRITYNLPALRREREELRQLATASRIGSRFRRMVLTDG